jgi:hypothetical protein
MADKKYRLVVATNLSASPGNRSSEASNHHEWKANRNVGILLICWSTVGMRMARDPRMGYRAANVLSSCGDFSESERIVVVRTVRGDADRLS